jgi:hypothetical protein
MFFQIFRSGDSKLPTNFVGEKDGTQIVPVESQETSDRVKGEEKTGETGMIYVFGQTFN